MCNSNRAAASRSLSRIASMCRRACAGCANMASCETLSPTAHGASYSRMLILCGVHHWCEGTFTRSLEVWPTGPSSTDGGSTRQCRQDPVYCIVNVLHGQSQCCACQRGSKPFRVLRCQCRIQTWDSPVCHSMFAFVLCQPNALSKCEGCVNWPSSLSLYRMRYRLSSSAGPTLPHVCHVTVTLL